MKTAIDIDKKYGREIKIDRPGLNVEAFISPYNRRVRLIDYSGSEKDKAALELKKIAAKYDFASKIFAKVRKADSRHFIENRFEEEGVIRGYFNGKDAVVVANYPDESRRRNSPEIARREAEIERKLTSCAPSEGKTRVLPEGCRMTIPESKEDYEALASLYGKVFETYPFPITEPAYLEETAGTHVIYVTVKDRANETVAAGSAEMDLEHKNAEITDFATLPSQRGKGLAGILLRRLEELVRKRGILNLYTIARSRSFGVNRIFKKAGYEMTGKLINNCCICGDFENMTIWCKKLK